MESTEGRSVVTEGTEAPETGEVDQSQFGDAYMSSHELIDDDGQPYESNKTTEPKQSENSAETKDVEETKAPVTSEGEKPAQDKTEGEPTKPEGLEKSFYDDDGKGVLSFNPSKAVEYLIPKADSEIAFKYESPKYEDGKAEPTTEEEKKSYRDTEVQYQTDLRSRLTEPLQAMLDYMKQGYTQDQAANAALNGIDGTLRTHMDERMIKHNDDRFNEQSKSIESKAELSELKSKSNANWGLFAKGVGGGDNLNELLFKHGKGYINKLFDLMNPGHEKTPKGQISGDIDKWFTKFSSNHSNMAFAVEITQLAILRDKIPLILKGKIALNEKVKADLESSALGGVGGPSQEQSVHTKEETDNSTDIVEQYLNGDAGRQRPIPTV